ncbi:MAG TPA: 30S ribosomal protein S8 [Thermodesulfobacteriota bacterium]|nr:30S ribosomal protein S8 [Thermodesulfobacteriota bacterium]
MLTDPIADMLTRIRNASRARHETVDMPSSRLKERIAEVLKEEGYIKGYRTIPEGGNKVTLRIFLKYTAGNESVIAGLRRVSRPGVRVYVRRDQIPRVRNGLGISILSTSKGIVTDRVARRERVGGELLCMVW